jgi:hypothetical protein
MRFETSFDLVGDLIVVDADVLGPNGTRKDSARRRHRRRSNDLGAIDCGVDRIRRRNKHSTDGDENGDRRRARVPSATRRAKHSRAHRARRAADLGYGVDGVLGMSFLLDFNIEIRPAERRILVERITP